MSDYKRFPNKADLEDLRKEGKLAVSSYFCRISASLLTVFYLLSTSQSKGFQKILAAKELDVNVLQVLLDLSATLLVALLVFLSTYVFLTLLQSKFYFGLNGIFKFRRQNFGLRRVLQCFSPSNLLALLGLLFATGISIFLAWQFLPFRLLADAGTFQAGADPAMLKEQIIGLCRKLIYAFSALLFIFALVVLVYDKLRFLINNRVELRRGE